MEKRAGAVDPPKEIYFEYARKVVWPTADSPSSDGGKSAATRAPPMRPVYTLDFAVTGRGVTFENLGTEKGGHGSVLWHVYTMPVGGRTGASRRRTLY